MTSVHPDDGSLIAYALADLDPGECHSVETHLGACGTCSAQVEELARALDVGRGGRDSSAPANVLVEILSHQAELRGTRASLLHHLRRPAPLLVTAGVAALIFGAGYLRGRSAPAAASSPRVEAHGTFERRAPLPAPPSIPFET